MSPLFRIFFAFIKIHDSLFYLKKSHSMVILYYSTTRISFFVHTLLLQNRFIGYVLLLQILILKPQPFHIIRIPIEDFCISVETYFIYICEYCRIFNSENQKKSFFRLLLHFLFIYTLNINFLNWGYFIMSLYHYQ